jgi:hypothetical protein
MVRTVPEASPFSLVTTFKPHEAGVLEPLIGAGEKIPLAFKSKLDFRTLEGVEHFLLKHDSVISAPPLPPLPPPPHHTMRAHLIQALSFARRFEC